MKYIPPKRPPEAEIQALFYNACWKANLTCHLEYYHDLCSFDAVIVKNEEIACIIEIKSYTDFRLPNLKTKQFRKYNSFKIPVIYLTRVEYIDKCILAIKRVLSTTPPE